MHPITYCSICICEFFSIYYHYINVWREGGMHTVCAYVENPGQLCGVASLTLPLCGLQGWIQILWLPKQSAFTLWDISPNTFSIPYLKTHLLTLDQLNWYFKDQHLLVTFSADSNECVLLLSLLYKNQLLSRSWIPAMQTMQRGMKTWVQFQYI